jgi:BirA family biotin operon repressor/biotin-[acetyl-CoA-carboxylase] ligase
MRQNGIIKSADRDGFLWIDLENEGLKKFFHKDIEMLY